MKTIRTFTITLAALFALATLSQSAHHEDWKKIFNGKNLKGWTIQWPGQWSVEDGVLIGKQDPETGGDSWLFTNHEFTHYTLSLEFNHTSEHNSGVGICMPKEHEGRPSQYGYEIQISDIDEKFPTGSVFRHVSAKSGAQKEGWNNMVITVTKNHVKVELNGKAVTNSDVEDTHTGRIGLQVHGGEKFKDQVVKFRKIKIQKL